MCDSDDDVMNSNPSENTSTPSKNITSDKDETDSAHSPCESDIESYQRMTSLVKDQICFTPQDRPLGLSTPIHNPNSISISYNIKQRWCM